MTFASRYPVAIQIAAGFLVGIMLLAIVATVGVQRVMVMRARANEATALGSITTLTRDVMVQMLQLRKAPSNRAAAEYLSADLATLKRSDETDAVDSARLEQIDIEEAQIESDVETVKKRFYDDAAFQQLQQDEDTLLLYATTQAKTASDEFEQALGQVIAMLVGSSAAAVLALGLTAFIVGGGISRRLRRVTSALQDVTLHDVTNLTSAFGRLSSGDLSATFNADRMLIMDAGHDEIALLAQSYNGLVAGLGLVSSEFNRMTQTLRDMIAGIAATTGNVATVSSRMSLAASESTSAVEQISISIASVVDGARAQAERIATAGEQIDALSKSAGRIATSSHAQADAATESVAAVRRLDAQISAFASLGASLAQAASHAQARAGSGRTSVDETAAAMARIKETTGVAQTAMLTLEASSGAVSEIVGVIEEIAEQTNLLALNAAIEAARAGDHGRGFAVVADEVRKLAEQSRSATARIGHILVTIRNESVRSAEAIATAWERMDAGAGLSLEAKAALEAIGVAIAQTAQIAVELAERSTEMQAASRELTRGIGSISNVIDDNASTAASVSESGERILQTIHPVAALADAQATTAREVSDAIVELSGQILEVDASSRDARAQSEHLRDLVGVFRNLGDAVHAPPPSRAQLISVDFNGTRSLAG